MAVLNLKMGGEDIEHPNWRLNGKMLHFCSSVRSLSGRLSSRRDHFLSLSPSVRPSSSTQREADMATNTFQNPFIETTKSIKSSKLEQFLSLICGEVYDICASLSVSKGSCVVSRIVVLRICYVCKIMSTYVSLRRHCPRRQFYRRYKLLTQPYLLNDVAF